MLRTLAFIVSGAFSAVSGTLGVLAALPTSAMTADQAVRQTHFVDAIIVLTVLAIVAVVVLAIVDNQERRIDKAEREKLHMQVADLHADRFTKYSTIAPSPPHQAVSGSGTVVNPTIAESVKNGDALTRFQREGITTLRRASLRLAKLYRDFASKPVSDEDIASTKYLKDFWEAFPFRELDALKERIKNILGFSVTSAAEELPSRPEKIMVLARHLEKEALKVPEDVPL